MSGGTVAERRRVIRCLSREIEATVATWLAEGNDPADVCAALGLQITRVFRAWAAVETECREEIGRREGEWEWELTFDEFVAALKVDLSRKLQARGH